MPRLTNAGNWCLLVVNSSIGCCLLWFTDSTYSMANKHFGTIHPSLNSTAVSSRSGTKKLDGNNSWVERINLKVISSESTVLPDWDMLEVRQVIVEAIHVIPTKASSGHTLNLGPQSYFMLAYSEM